MLPVWCEGEGAPATLYLIPNPHRTLPNGKADNQDDGTAFRTPHHNTTPRSCITSPSRNAMLLRHTSKPTGKEKALFSRKHL
jgi:hypothetical protein